MKQIIKVLAVDREEIILKSIVKALKSNTDIEYVVKLCSTAVDGLKLIRNDTFDLVFIDIVLPGMNGIEVLRRIKNISPEVPVIVMSGFSSVRIQTTPAGEENSANEILNKAAGFLLKPFTTQEINSLAFRVLKQNTEE